MRYSASRCRRSVSSEPPPASSGGSLFLMCAQYLPPGDPARTPRRCAAAAPGSPAAARPRRRWPARSPLRRRVPAMPPSPSGGSTPLRRKTAAPPSCPPAAPPAGRSPGRAGQLPSQQPAYGGFSAAGKTDEDQLFHACSSRLSSISRRNSRSTCCRRSGARSPRVCSTCSSRPASCTGR